MTPRYPGTPQHGQAGRYIGKQLKRAKFQVYQQQWKKLFMGKEVELTNIIGLRRGKTNQLILLGTHYDTRRFASREKRADLKKKPVPGGNDGSSGTALLLSLAEEIPKKLPVSLLLAFFDAEDQGDISGFKYSHGSAHFALHPVPDLPDKVVIVDMICQPGLTLYYEASTYRAFPRLYQSIWNTAQRLRVKGFQMEPKLNILDDHIPFARLGIPSALLIDLDYPAWHTVRDTVQQCDLDSLVKVGEVLKVWVNEQ